MRNKIFSFLRQYSTDTISVDRLIVSSFLYKNQIAEVNNIFLGEYVIGADNSPSEFEQLEKFVEIIENEQIEFHLEDLIELFEFVISPADRVVNGAIYTPENIRRFIVKESLANLDLVNGSKIADIACGCGGFLLTVAQRIKEITDFRYADIFRDHIFGLDIQEYSTIRAKLLLTILAVLNDEDEEHLDFKIFTGDALNYQWQEQIENFQGFQAVVGNPPYVSCRNLDAETKEALRNWPVARSGNPDLYIPFFQIGLTNLAEQGTLGFITMNTFFKSLNGRDLREYFWREGFNFRIIDFGARQVFRSRNTYTCICLITKEPSEHIHYYKSGSVNPELEEINYQQIAYNRLESRNGWNLENHYNISIIEATGRPFGSLFKTRHGIATLKNDVYIFDPIAEDQDFYYLQSERIFPIEKTICRDIVNSNKLSRPIDLIHLTEKIIFPYDGAEKPKVLPEQVLMEDYPMAYAYLLEMKDILDKRDKGKGKYDAWFAFGRTQSLDRIVHKLFFPKYSDNTPSFILNDDPGLLFYNGLAVIADYQQDLLLAKKIMQTRLFWYYISSTSKPYSSSYYSLNGNYIRNFGVCELTEEERQQLIQIEDQTELDAFFEARYGLVL